MIPNLPAGFVRCLMWFESTCPPALTAPTTYEIRNKLPHSSLTGGETKGECTISPSQQMTRTSRCLLFPYYPGPTPSWHLLCIFENLKH